MRSEPNRLEWADALKGYAIICVTLGHLGCNLLLEKHIYSFHMFVFFLMSGYFDKSDAVPFKTYIIKKANSVLTPFFAWGLVSGLISVCLGRPIIDTLKTLFVLNGEVSWNAPIWFLLVLFITQTLYAFLKKFLHVHDVVLLVVSLLVWFITPQANCIFKLNLIPMALSFYILGIVYRNTIQPYEKKLFCNRYAKAALLMLLLTLNVLFGVFLNVRIVYTKAVFGNIAYCFAAAITGTLFYVFSFESFSFLSKSKLLKYLGKKSLLIMASQFFLFKTYDYIAGYTVHLLRNDWKALCMCAVTILIICLLSELFLFIGKRNEPIRKIGSWFGLN